MASAAHTPLRIFFINHDWRDIFRTDVNELREKLERDHFNPSLNTFFFFSYAHTGYTQLEGQYQTVHVRTRLKYLKPLLDLTTLVRVPYAAWRYKVRPDAWVVGDFGAVPGAWIASRLFGGVLVMSINNQPVIYSKVRKFGRIKACYTWVTERLFFRLVDRYFTINTTLRDYLEAIGVPRDRITIFSMNTIVRDSKHIAAAQRGVIRKRYSLPEHTKVLITVARLEAEKNWPRSLELFASLPKEYVLFCLGPGSLEGELRAQVERLGIADRVYFEGFVKRDDIWNYYADADAFILLSKAEALGIVFWEAMYMSVPTLGSTAAGIVESLGADGDRGRIWREEDGREGYEERVRFCVTDSPVRTEVLKRARHYVEGMIQNTVSINDVVSKSRI